MLTSLPVFGGTGLKTEQKWQAFCETIHSSVLLSRCHCEAANATGNNYIIQTKSWSSDLRWSREELLQTSRYPEDRPTFIDVLLPKLFCKVFVLFLRIFGFIGSCSGSAFTHLYWTQKQIQKTFHLHGKKEHSAFIPKILSCSDWLHLQWWDESGCCINLSVWDLKWNIISYFHSWQLFQLIFCFDKWFNSFFMEQNHNTVLKDQEVTCLCQI